MHASFKPVPAMIVESAYYAYALLSDSFFIVFPVQGVKKRYIQSLIKISVSQKRFLSNLHLELKNYKDENFIQVSCLY